MIRKKHKRNFKKREYIKANQNIRFPQVRVLSETGKMLGVMDIRSALKKAYDQEKDLVLITEKANPPIVKIIELAKFKYQQKQKQSENRKKSKKQDIKEVRFTPFIGEGDFQTRLKKINKFLEKGDKVRLTIEFRRGRQLTKKNFGYETLHRVFAATEEIAEIEIEPKMIGTKLMAQIMPKKKK